MTRNNLRPIVKSLYAIQKMRIETANRLELKADGSRQDKDNVLLNDDSVMIMVDVLQDMQDSEEKLKKHISKIVHHHSLWTGFLKHVKGCGELMAAVIISEIDIEKATTVSKIWQYAGMNPKAVKGTKGSGSKKDGTFELVKTDDLVRGDRLTPGYLSPYNSFLKTKLLGVLGSSFIKCNSPYRKYYDDMKTRLENSDRQISGKGKSWSETTKMHRHNAANRYMVKMFLKDLYVAWRTVEGLPVRPSYQEEYLGHRHAG